MRTITPGKEARPVRIPSSDRPVRGVEYRTRPPLPGAARRLGRHCPLCDRDCYSYPDGVSVCPRCGWQGPDVVAFGATACCDE